MAVMTVFTDAKLPISFSAIAIPTIKPAAGASTCRSSLGLSAAKMEHQTRASTTTTMNFLRTNYISSSKTGIKQTVRSASSSSSSSIQASKNVRVQRSQKWAVSDIANLFALCSMHFLCLFAPFNFNWNAFFVGLGLMFVSSICITLSYHRNLAHKSFKLPKWLEYLFAYFAAHSLQRDPLFWVSVHRYHHEYVDTERDPHSPMEGFWFSHIGWIMDTEYIAKKVGEPRGGVYSNVEDLKRQPFYWFLHRTYFMHIIALAAVLYALGGFPFVVFGMGLRITITLHVTFLVNSASHIWGKRAWNTKDDSKNNWFVGLLAYGEGWHNNHHAFPQSARHGLQWWQIDTTWYLIKFLEAIGLATDVKLPTEAQIQKMALPS